LYSLFSFSNEPLFSTFVIPLLVAGLMPEQDFLLGTTACALKSADVLARVLRENLDRVVELYVYNSESDMVRVVGLLPTYSWGDHNSLLGAEVGTGYLHRLPSTCRNTIGQSVERKVQVLVGNDDEGSMDLNEGNVQMEHHLEMEVDTEESIEESTKQPHQLGIVERSRSLETEESMRSISLLSETGGEKSPQHANHPDPDVMAPNQSYRQDDTKHRPTDRKEKEEDKQEHSIPANESEEESHPQFPVAEHSSLPPFPDAAPLKDVASFPPPPPPEHGNIPPPPPPENLPTPRPTPSPPAPDAAKVEIEDVHSDDDAAEEDDSDGEEYETDSEEEEGDDDDDDTEKKLSGGFFANLMPAPPKMHY
jgi:hypothetical protein